jgi:hypothetical protein
MGILGKSAGYPVDEKNYLSVRRFSTNSPIFFFIVLSK